jgi:hypothetical protein
MQISNNTISTATKYSPPTIENQKSQGFIINDLLTANDKKLVEAATGELRSVSSSGLHEVNQLATRIAIDRETGTLSGEVGEDYINKLITEQSSNNHAETIQFSALQKSLEFLKQERADFFRRTAA